MSLRCHHYPTAFVIQMVFFAAIPFASFSLYIPAFPAIEADLNISREALSFTVMASMISFPVSSFFLGPISDAIGRRPVLIFSFLSFLIGTVICFMANGAEMLFAGRAFQGVGGAGTSILSRAMCRDFMDDIVFMDAVGWLGVALGMVPLFAPMIGGYITDYLGWRMNFGLLFFVALVALAMVIYVTRETHHYTRRIALDYRLFIKEYWHLFSSKDFLMVMFCPSIFFIFIGINVTVISFYLHDKGFSLIGIGLVQGITSVFMILGRTLTISGIKRNFTELWLWLAAAWVMFIATLIVTLAFIFPSISVWFVVAALSLTNFSAGLSAPIVNKNTMAVMPWIPGISSSLTVASMVLLEAGGSMVASMFTKLKVSSDTILIVAIMVLGVYTLWSAYLSKRVVLLYSVKQHSSD